MSVFVTVRARLNAAPTEIQKLHDEVTAATRAQAQQAGDLGHRVYLNAQDPRDFLGIDEWKSAEAFQQFASNPKIREFFGRMFEGEPEVKVWTRPNWNQW